MTNIVASIVIGLSTNWSTVSKTVPVCNMVGCIVAHPTTLNQVGVVTTNKYAVFAYKDKKHKVLLEELGQNPVTLSRQIGEDWQTRQTNLLNLFYAR